MEGMTLNLDSSNKGVDLQPGKVVIWIAGGCGVQLNDFTAHFLDLETNRAIEASVVISKIQWIKNGRKAKRMLKAVIPEGGKYKIVLHGTDSLEVRKSNLFVTSLFQKPLQRDQIELIIE